jgi:hypothetical protein
MMFIHRSVFHLFIFLFFNGQMEPHNKNNHFVVCVNNYFYHACFILLVISLAFGGIFQNFHDGKDENTRKNSQYDKQQEELP